MDIEKLPTGVEVRRQKVRIWFMWQGKRRYESIGKITPAAIKRAAILRTEVVSLIRSGVFDEELYLRYFPDTHNIKSKYFSQPDYNFFYLCQKYLDSIEVGKDTRADYKKSLNRCWVPIFAQRDIRTIKVSDIKEAIKANNYKTARTRNNTLTPLRGVFRMALDDNLIDINPMDKIDSPFDKNYAPDPLSIDQKEMVLEYLKAKSHPIYHHYFMISMEGGFRQPSESTGIHWSNIDFHENSVLISQRIVGGVLETGTKTGNDRTVYLTDRAMSSIHAMRKYTDPSGGFLFRTPNGTPLFSPNRTLNPTWNEALEKSGIRKRAMRQTRHTAATQWIMAGLNINFVAHQLGDRVDTVLKHYAKWLDKQGTKAEMEKLNSFHKRDMT